MSDVTLILSRIDAGDPAAGDQLLPLVYEQLKSLAAAKLSREKPGQTLQATALVHEAYLRLVGPTGNGQQWNGRGHFFAAAAEAMRRILVEKARWRARVKHGGGRERVELDQCLVATLEPSDELLALDDALNRLAACDPHSAEIVKLRYFAGLTIPEAAAILCVSPRKADFLWSFARAWLRSEMNER